MLDEKDKLVRFLFGHIDDGLHSRPNLVVVLEVCQLGFPFRVDCFRYGFLKFFDNRRQIHKTVKVRGSVPYRNFSGIDKSGFAYYTRQQAA